LEFLVTRPLLFFVGLLGVVLCLTLFSRWWASKSNWVTVVDWSARQSFDKADWIFEKGFLRNEEEQYYTGGAEPNFQVTPNGLELVARGERVPNDAYRKGGGDWKQTRAEARYTSTSLLSKKAWQNLKVEIVAGVQGGKGAWPAIWLRSPNTRGFGEVDLMEHLGREPELVHSTVHFGASKSDRDVKTADRTIPGFQGRDVVYSAELSPGKLLVSIDGKPMIAMDRDLAINGVRPLQQPFNLIINLALGGAWAGPIDEAALPATMTIKAIRIWEWRLGQKKDEVTASEQ
jgi:beta-glucanase (GH16 family)